MCDMLACQYMTLGRAEHEKGARKGGFRMFEGVREREARSNP